MDNNKEIYENLELKISKLENELSLYKSIIDNLPIPIYVKDLQNDNKYTVWNKALESFTGKLDDQIINSRGYLPFIKNEESCHLKNDEFSNEDGKGTGDISLEHMSTAKGVKIVQSRAIEIYDKDKPLKLLLGYLEDITLKTQSEKAFKTSEEKYRRIIETIREGYCLLDEKGNVVDVNHAYCKLLGYTKEELLSKSISEIELYPNKDDTKQFYERIKETGHFRFETKHQHKNGNLLEVEVNVSFSPSIDNQFIMIIHDIAGKNIDENLLKEKNDEIKTQNEALLKANDELQRAIEKSKADETLKTELLSKFNESQRIASIGTWEWDMLSNKVWWSEETYRIFELNPLEFTPDFNNNAKYVHPDDLEDYFKLFEKSIQSGELLNHDFRIKTPTGKIKASNVNGQVLFENNKPIKFIGTIMDISSRKEIEMALRESEKRFSLSLKNTPLTIAAQDSNFRYIWAYNQKATNQQNVIGKTDYDLFPAESAQKLVSLKQQVLKEEKEMREKLWIQSNGLELFLDLYIEPFRDENGQVIGVAMVSIDRTKEKLAEEALKLSEEKFRLMINNSNDTIVMIDGGGTQFFISDASQRITGYSPDETARPFKEFIHPDDLGTVMQVWNKVLENKDIAAYVQYRHKHKTGGYVWLEAVAQNYLDHPSIKSVIVNVRDISFNKQAELKLKASEEQLQRLNSDKDRFISILAHDLKNPFSSLFGFSNLLVKNLRKYDIDKIENQLHIINNTTKRIYDLLEDILMWVRAQSGKLPFEPVPFDFLSSCRDVIENLQFNAISKNIRIHYFTKSDIEVYADQNMFKTILRNLVSNAIKYTKIGGEINVHAEKEHSEIVVTVSDSGIGIEHEKLIKLFSISDIHTMEGTEGEKGSGLGLLICKEFVEKHGGRIWVESEPEKGSQFKFSLPFGGKFE